MVLVLCAFFSPALTGPGQFLERDSGRLHYPVKRYIGERIAEGHFPQWNPYNGLGEPLVAGAVHAVQHPFSLLLAALPYEAAFKAWALLSYLLAAVGAFAWARLLGRDRLPSCVAGLSFALCGHMVSTSDNFTYLTTYAAVPAYLAGAHWFMARGGALRLAVAGLLSFLCAAGGDPVAWAMTSAALSLYGALVVWEPLGRARAALRGALVLLAAVGGAGPVIFPVVAFAASSSRGDAFDAYELVRWNLAPVRLAEFVLPYLFRSDPGLAGSKVFMVYAGDGQTTLPWAMSIYLGAAAAALAVLGAAVDRRARWLLAAAFVAIWMAMGSHAGFGQLAKALPLLSNLRYWEKLAFWPGLLVAGAAAFGLDALRDQGKARRAGRSVVVVGSLLLLFGAAAFAGRASLAAALSRPLPSELASMLQPADAMEAAQALSANLALGLVHAGAALLLLSLPLFALARGLRPRVSVSIAAAIAVLDLFVANARAYVLIRPEPWPTSSELVRYLKRQPLGARVATPLVPPWFAGDAPYPGTTRYASQAAYPEFNTADHIDNFDPYTGMVPVRQQRFMRRSRSALLPVPRQGLWGVEYVVVPLELAQAKQVGVREPFDVAMRDARLNASLVRIPHRARAYLAGELGSVDRRAAMEFALSTDPAVSEASVVEGPVPSDYAPPRG